MRLKANMKNTSALEQLLDERRQQEALNSAIKQEWREKQERDAESRQNLNS